VSPETPKLSSLAPISLTLSLQHPSWSSCVRASTSPTRFALHSPLFPPHLKMSPTRVRPIGVTKPPNNEPGRRNGRRSPGGASSEPSSSPSTDPVARARELFPTLAGKNQVAQLLAAVSGLTCKSARTVVTNGGTPRRRAPQNCADFDKRS